MPHLDEGQLHALLDEAYAQDAPETVQMRAHLADCAFCRAQLEQERSLRERAALILRSARPGSEEVPPFNQILQRADRTPVRRRLPALTSLAWAASIMLALGAGWISRGMFPQWTARERAEEPGAAVSSAVDASADVATVPPPPPAVTGEGASQRTQLRDQPATQSSRAAVESGAAAPPAAAVAPVERPRAEVAQKVTTAVTTGARRADSVPVPLAVPPPSPPAPQTQARAAERSLVQPAGAVGQAALASAPLTWTYAPRADAERMAGRNVLLVPELPVVSVGVASRAGAWLLRATQRLPDGATIEFIQEPIVENREALNFAERDAARSRVANEELVQMDATGASWVMVLRSGVRVTARATLSADSLRALVLRLR